MRSNLENSHLFGVKWHGGEWGAYRKVLTGNVVIQPDGPVVHFLDLNGVARNVTLPTLKDGRLYVVSNVGTSGTITLKDALGATVTSITPARAVMVISSLSEWIVVGTGTTAGGSGITAVIEDPAPVLGGSLDGGGFDISNVDDATFDSLTVTDQVYDATTWNGNLTVPTKNAVRDKFESLAGVTDGDKGDILVASAGTVWTVQSIAGFAFSTADAGADAIFGWDDSANSYANLTATDARAAAGLGTAAVKNTGTSGNNVPLLDGANTWSADQIVPDEAYDATAWNGSLEVPTKNAIRDKIESLVLGGSGNVTKVGTPVDNQIGVWTGDGTIEGDSALTFDTTTDTLLIGDNGAIAIGDATSQVRISHSATSDSITIAADPNNLTANTQLVVSVDGVVEVVLTGTALSTGSNDGAALGTSALGWSDLHLATGGVINWANGEVSLTETDANTLTLAGGTLVVPNTGLQVGASVPFSDSAGVLTLQNVDALDVTTAATVLASFSPLPVANGGTGQITEAEAVGELTQALSADATPDISADYVPTYDASADTGKKVLLSTIVRDRLTANRDYYVRTDGSDSNTGLVDSSGGAWLTIQKAVDHILLNVDKNSYKVNINVGAGTFLGAVVSGSFAGGGEASVNYDFYIIGAGVDTTFISDNGAGGLAGRHFYVTGASFHITQLTLVAEAGGGYGINIYYNSTVGVTGPIKFDVDGAAYGIYLEYYTAFCQIVGGSSGTQAVTITGSPTTSFIQGHFGSAAAFITFTGEGLTFTGTPDWGNAFAVFDQHSTLIWAVNPSGGMSGSSTGKRFAFSTGARIAADWIGTPIAATALPGDEVGTLATGASFNGEFSATLVNGYLPALTGKQTIWVPAGAMTSRTTSGAAATTRETNGITMSLLAFDTAADEGANFHVAFPKSWNAGPVTYQAFWTAASSTGTVEFELRGGCFANDAAINTSGLGTAVAVADTLLATNDVHVTSESSAVTLSNAAADTVAFFEIIRDVSDDTLGADAELIGIKFFYTTSVGNDA